MIVRRTTMRGVSDILHSDRVTGMRLDTVPYELMRGIVPMTVLNHATVLICT